VAHERSAIPVLPFPGDVHQRFPCSEAFFFRPQKLGSGTSLTIFHPCGPGVVVWFKLLPEEIAGVSHEFPLQGLWAHRSCSVICPVVSGASPAFVYGTHPPTGVCCCLPRPPGRPDPAFVNCTMVSRSPTATPISRPPVGVGFLCSASGPQTRPQRFSFFASGHQTSPPSRSHNHLASWLVAFWPFARFGCHSTRSEVLSSDWPFAIFYAPAFRYPLRPSPCVASRVGVTSPIYAWYCLSCFFALLSNGRLLPSRPRRIARCLSTRPSRPLPAPVVAVFGISPPFRQTAVPPPD